MVKGNFHESFRDAPPAPPSARATGLVFAAVALIVAALFYGSPKVWGTALVLAVAFALTSWLRPGLLEPLNRAWFRLSLLLNRIVNPLVMALIYLVAIVPSGLIMQLLRDPLGAKRSPERTTYWSERKPSGENQSMTQQF